MSPTVAVNESYALPHAILLAGRDRAEFDDDLIERRCSFSATVEREIAIDKEKTYDLPDGNGITVGDVSVGDKSLMDPSVLLAITYVKETAQTDLRSMSSTQVENASSRC